MSGNGGKVSFAPVPSNYDGRDKRKYKSWRASVFTYFNAYAADFGSTTDPTTRESALKKWITFVLAYLKADNDEECPSSLWVENFRRGRQNDDYELSLSTTFTMKEFWDSLDQSFSDQTEKQLAEIKLQKFYQGKQSFQNYIQEFEILAQRVEYTLTGTAAHNIHLISLLERQVHREMIDKMYGTDIAPPTTYAEYKTRLNNISINIEKRKALNAGSNWQTALPQQQQGSSSTTRTGSGDSPRSSSGVTPGYGAPMDVDRKRSRGPVCYNCQKPGHIAVNCRAPKAKTRVRALLQELKEGKEIKVDDLKKAMNEEGF
jgi:hypothetical protein